jgi:3-hydroxyisobutyrate dehydrogenase-like beta-hydroxyacid dehydrogenase
MRQIAGVPMNVPIRTVGIVGLGNMGARISHHLIARGFAVIGYDVNPAAKNRAASELKAVGSPADVARQSDLVIILTGYENEVESALFGKDGVVEGARSETIVCVSSTVAPQSMKQFGARLIERKLVPIDAPLCRGEAAAEAGELLVVGGGDAAAFERCKPAFAAFSNACFHLGELGSGQVGKMVNNQILWACVCANLEALQLGQRYGVDREMLRSMLVASSARNWALEARALEVGQTTSWAEKDMMIVLQEADVMRLSLPLAGVVKEVIKGFEMARQR